MLFLSQPARLSPRRFALWATLCSLLVTACSPTFDWRDVRPPESGARLLMPCKPAAQDRRISLAGSTVRLTLLACSAGGLTWGLAHADIAEASLVAAALQALRSAAAANLGVATAAGVAGAIEPLAVPGATPSASAGRSRLAGRKPDGAAVQMELVVFARGTRVFQASVLGERLPPDAVDTFLTSIRIE